MSSTKQMRFNCECCGYATDKKSSMTTHEKTKKHASNLIKQQVQIEGVKEQHERDLMGLNDVNVFIPEPIVEEETPEPEKQEIEPLGNLITKLETAGIDKMCLIYGEQFKRRITNMKSSRIPLEKRLSLIRGKIFQEVSNNPDKSIAQKILDKYFQKKEVAKKDASWVEDFTIGEEVLIFERRMKRKGVVKKINKTSVSVDLFHYSEIDDRYALENQTYGKNRLIWSSWTDKRQVIYSRDGIIKKGQETYYDKEFLEGGRSVDYGW